MYRAPRPGLRQIVDISGNLEKPTEVMINSIGVSAMFAKTLNKFANKKMYMNVLTINLTQRSFQRFSEEEQSA